jgi:hypothetical protein
MMGQKIEKQNLNLFGAVKYDLYLPNDTGGCRYDPFTVVYESTTPMLAID